MGDGRTLQQPLGRKTDAPSDQSYSASNPWLENLRFRLFSVTVRTAPSGVPPAMSASISSVTLTAALAIVSHVKWFVNDRSGATSYSSARLAPDAQQRYEADLERIEKARADSIRKN